MHAIKAKVQNGRIEPESPLDLPDGTDVIILPAIAADSDDCMDGWDDSPEGIAARQVAYDALEPLIFTAEEAAALEADRQARKAWELAHFDQRAERLRKLWE
jgi:hypothetical protein